MSNQRNRRGLATQIGRRTFLGLSGAAAGAALLQGCAKQETKLIEQALKRSSTNPGEASWRRSLCLQCGAACELSVRTIDGRAKKIEGDASSPMTHGGVCALGHSALQELYHPNRILMPQRERGVEASWEEVLSELGPLVEQAATTAGAIAFCCSADPVERSIVERFAADLNASVTIVEPPSAAVERQARKEFFGADVELFPDLDGADLIVASGASILDRWGNPVAQAHAVAELQARGGLLIAIGERMSLTAAKADLWLPTQGSLASLYVALAQLRTGAGLAGIDLESVAAGVGLDVERVQRLAEILLAAERPLILVGGERASVPDVVAGYELQRAFGAVPLAVDTGSLLSGDAGDAAAPATKTLAELRDAMVKGSVQLIISVGVDLVGAVPASWGLAQTFGEDTRQRLLSLAVTPDASTQRAHWVLPIQCGLERIQVSLAGYGDARSGPAALAIADPVVAARGAARHPIDVLLAIREAASISSTHADWKDASAARDAVVENAADLGGETARSVLSATKREGGRVALRPETLENASAVAPAMALNSHEAGSIGATPIEARIDSELHVGLFEGVRGERYGWGRPWLNELPDPMSSVMWGSWIELAPADASPLGISAGDLVVVTSPDGRLETTAFLQPAMRPGSAAMPVGGFDPEAEGNGDPRNLVAAESSSGIPAQSFSATLRKKSAGSREAAPIFGRGLHSAEQIPAGWKSHHAESGSTLITIGQASDSGSSAANGKPNSEGEQNHD